MAGEKTGEAGRNRRRALVLTLAALLSLAAIAPAADAKKKKKKKKAAAITRTSTVPFAAGGTQTVTASCPKGRHISGGGFAASPNFVPSGPSGLRSITATSHSEGAKSWTASGTAFTNPAASGDYTTFARCESDALGQLTVAKSSSGTLNPGVGTVASLNCGTGTHVISGGYAGTAASNPGILLGFRLVVLQSQRTGPGQWTVSAYNSGLGASPVPVTITIYALCERNGKGRSVSEAASVSTPLVANTRAAADATCSKKTHAVSGGFNITPNGEGSVPAVGVDEFNPVGQKGWHLGLHPWQGVAIPPNSALQTFAYCKKG
jgi:hypothetical protein